MKTHLVVLPAYNEEQSIHSVIEEIKQSMPSVDILVVDDGSTDQTGRIARMNPVRVITHPFNLGYGAALQTGFRYATRKGHEFVVTIDADGQHIPASAAGLIEAMERENADVVIGSRFINGTFRVGGLKNIGIKIFSFIAKTYTGIEITDPTSGFQLLNRKAFSYLADGDNYPFDYPDVNIIMALHKQKFKIIETPVPMRSNKYGKSMHSGLRPVLYVIKMCLAIIMVLVRRGGK